MSLPMRRPLRVALRAIVVLGLLAGGFTLLLRHHCLLGGYPGIYGGSCYRNRNYVSDELEGPSHKYQHNLIPPQLEVVMVSTPKEQAEGKTAWMSQQSLARMTGLPETHVKVRKYVAGDVSAEYHPRFNKGHEVSTYLSYIAEKYDDLPDVVLFLHAEEHAWHVEPLLLGSLSYAISRLDLDQVRDRGFANLRVSWRGGCPDGIDLSSSRSRGRVGREVPYVRQALLDNFGPSALPKSVAAPCCNQFAVTREAIRSRPRAQYERSLEWLRQTPLDDYISGRVWEHMFQILFSGRARDCPDQRKTYCTLYGLCLTPAQWREYQAAEQEDVELRRSVGNVWGLAWKPQIIRRLVELGGTMRRLRRAALLQGREGEVLKEIQDLYHD